MTEQSSGLKKRSTPKIIENLCSDKNSSSSRRTSNILEVPNEAAETAPSATTTRFSFCDFRRSLSFSRRKKGPKCEENNTARNSSISSSSSSSNSNSSSSSSISDECKSDIDYLNPECMKKSSSLIDLKSFCKKMRRHLSAGWFFTF